MRDSDISYRIVKIYLKTLASSTYVDFPEGRRQFIYKVFTRKYVETKKNYLQECILNTGGVTHTLTLYLYDGTFSKPHFSNSVLL